MAKTVILGAGFAGQYAALILSDALKGQNGHEVIMINPTDTFTYIPSLIWVGVGQFPVSKAQFALSPVYQRMGITFVQGLATEIHPDEQYVLVEPRNGGSKDPVRISYDYLINATGPHLNFEATPGLGPENGHTYSICTPSHAEQTARRYLQWIEELKKGRRATFVMGTGHGTCTCQGAAFEFISLIHNDLTDRGLRKQVDLKWISNEPRLGDFGIDGFELQMNPSVVFTSEDMADALYRDYGIEPQVRSHVQKVDEKYIYTEDYDGNLKEVPYDFAMLIPQFRGKPIRYLDKNGGDLSGTLLNPAGFMKVDGVYGKPYDQLDGPDWPKTYQNQTYKNMFAVGIAFAPPGFMSKPFVSASGTAISAAIPRTGYTSELTGKAAALNIAEMIQGREPCHTASMAETAGMCIASLKNSWTKGSAVSIGIHPIVRNRQRFPEGGGRDAGCCTADMGLAGAWFKKGLHHAFLYKLSAKPLWKLIP